MWDDSAEILSIHQWALVCLIVGETNSLWYLWERQLGGPWCSSWCWQLAQSSLYLCAWRQGKITTSKATELYLHLWQNVIFNLQSTKAAVSGRSKPPMSHIFHPLSPLCPAHFPTHPPSSPGDPKHHQQHQRDLRPDHGVSCHLSSFLCPV